MHDSAEIEEEVEDSEQEINSDDFEGSEDSLHSEKAEEVTEEEKKEEHIEEGPEEVIENEEVTSETIFTDSVDYSQYFENLQVLSFLQLAVMIAVGVAICFCKGFDKK
jgi:hypothetical protein